MAVDTNRATVKICGIQDIEVLKAIAHLPIDYIGYIFAKSRRQVTGQQAGEFIQTLRSSVPAGQPIPLFAGVFVNPSREELMAVMSLAPLDIVQLHGQESPELCRWVKDTFAVQVMKVVSIGGQPSVDSLDPMLLPYVGCLDLLLLDTFEPLVGGGSGQTFAWDQIPIYLQWAKAHHIPLLVAGGLHVGNVDTLLNTYKPDGVDVSSGVETDGMKDVHKITAFVERVKHHASNAG